MTTPLAGAIASLFAGLSTAGGETTIYRRGALSIEGVVAIAAHTRDEDNGAEITISPRDQDWIYRATDLIHAADQWTPEPGDLVDWTDSGGTDHRFEVIRREPNDRCYRFTDPSRQLVRVYTVEIAVPPEPVGDP